MNKTLIIIKREYLSRVKKKSFLILTLLVPFLFVGMGAVIGLVAASDSDLKEIAVIDQSHYFEGKLKNSSEVKYVFTQTSKDSLTAHIDKLPYDAILEIPEFDKYAKPIKFKLLFNEQLGIQTENRIESDLNDIIEDSWHQRKSN
jgi:ABC-2 type transport system permease protein